MSDLVSRLPKVRGAYTPNAPMSELTWFRAGGPAEVLFRPADVADLEAIAVDDEADVPALHGWRREIFGEQALALKAGRLALAVRGRRPVVIRLDQPA